MNVLLVAMCDSVHTARWLAQFEGTGVQFTLFPSTPHRRVHPQIRALLGSKSPFVVLGHADNVLALPLGLIDLVMGNRLRAMRLRKVIKEGIFDFTHLLETQHAGYLFQTAVQRAGYFRPVALSIWGSDLAWFSSKSRHRCAISATLAHVDLLFIECLRDERLAIGLGYRGRFSPPIPASGGMSGSSEEDGVFIQPSKRSDIVVKGYTGFVGMADVALKALLTIQDSLRGRQIHFYSVSVFMYLKLIIVRRRTGLDIRAYRKKSLSHQEVLSLFRLARLSLSLSKSDGLPGSMREAAWTGAFPIESRGSCVCDWTQEGTGVLIVNPDDFKEVAKAVVRVLCDDQLVDRAVAVNNSFVKRIGASAVQDIARKQYESLASSKRDFR